MKLIGLKKAVGAYQRLNLGPYSPWYGELMLDVLSGEVWTDEFYSLGHNEWKEYHVPTITNLSRQMKEYEIPITMKNVQEFVDKVFG